MPIGPGYLRIPQPTSRILSLSDRPEAIIKRNRLFGLRSVGSNPDAFFFGMSKPQSLR